MNALRRKVSAILVLATLTLVVVGVEPAAFGATDELRRGEFTVTFDACPKCGMRMRFSSDGRRACVNTSRVPEKERPALAERAFALMAKAADAKRGGPLRPTTGWSSWNTFGVDISEDIIVTVAEAMATNGLKAAGYAYVNIDDGFFNGHDPATGRLRWNLKRFPNGLKPVVDRIHALGLKAGIYSDAGSNTCGSVFSGDVDGFGSGLYGHDAADLRLHFNELGFDFIKVDYCGAVRQGLDERSRYTEIANAIRATGRTDVRFNICRWEFPGTWAADIAGSWRTTTDIRASWKSIRATIRENLYLAAYAKPGHYNDMDMLQVGRYVGEIRHSYAKEDVGLTREEEATHFGMWCMLSSPLLIGCDVRHLPDTTRELVTNPFLLAMNQNDLGLQGEVVDRAGETYVFAKDADARFGTARFVALYNAKDAPHDFSVRFDTVELGGDVAVMDLGERADLGVFRGAFSATVPAHGARFYRLDGARRTVRRKYEAESAYLSEYQELRGCKETSAKATARPEEDPAASGGVVVRYLGNRATNDLVWRNVRVSKDGRYSLCVTCRGKGGRAFDLQVDGGAAKHLEFKGDPSVPPVASFELKAGVHAVRISNAKGPCPDIDFLEIRSDDASSAGGAHGETTARIVRENGQPAIEVNGERLSPMTVSFNLLTLENMAVPFPTNAFERTYFRNLRASGLRIFFLGVTTRWNLPGDPARGVEDGIARAKTSLRWLLSAVPDAWVILRFNVSPPCSWVNAHPEEQVRFSDGKTRPCQCATCYPDGKLDGMYSMCSEAWRTRGAQAIEEFFAEFSKEPGFERVIGTFLGAGGTEEWYYPQVLHQEDGAYGDFSEPFRREYARYLREKYGTEENLRKAWRRPDATFARPPVPTPAEKAFVFDAPETIELGLVYREGAYAAGLPKFDRDARGPYNRGTFLNLDAAPHVADYFTAWHLGTARSLVHFARVLKRLHPNLLTGAFYGSLGQTNYLEGGSAGGVLHVLDSGALDFLAAPGVYKNRRPGGCVAMREAQDSFRIRNMIFFDETDMATHVRRNPELPAPPPGEPAELNWWAIDTPADMEGAFKREFARVLCTGIQGWWFDWPYPRLRWYDDPAIFALFARQQEIARDAYRHRRPKASEIAFVLDPDSSRLVSRLTARTVLDYWRVTDFSRLGAPTDCYLLDDLAHPEMPDYRLYVMANAYSMTPARREAVRKKARRNGATVLWLYAAGFANPEGTERMGVANVSETVGFPLGLIDGTFFPQFRVTDNTPPYVKGANRARSWGDLGRPVENGPAQRLAPQRFVNPGFFVNDPAATVLGRYQDGRVAMAAKRLDGYTSVYCGSLVLESDLLRRVAEGAGCHIYLRTDDVFYANGDFVTVHADGDGRRKIRFRGKCSPYEVYERKCYGRGVEEIEVEMRNGETRMWRLDDE